MAEESIYFADNDYLPDANPISDDIVDLDSGENDQVLCEEIPANAVPEASKEVPESLEVVESPSTGETYSYKCIFCEQHLTSSDEPKLLECLHNACGNCVKSKLYEHPDVEMDKIYVLECPLCNLPCDSSRIIDNQFLLENATLDDNASAKLSEMKCSSCSDDALATSWCMDCSEYICDSCVQAHQRLKITKDHTIKSKEECLNDNQSSSSSTSAANLFCAVHVHEKLSLFCETCDKLTCRDCQLTEHREHRYKFCTEIALETRKYIAEMLKDVGYKRTLLNSAMKVIDDRQTLIVDKKQTLVKEITQLVVKLTNTINVRGKQLVSKLNEVCDGKQKTLLEKKQALEQLSKMTDHCIEFTQNALDNGSDMALLFTKKQLTDHLKRIKCKRADIPNPEIPVRIHLALDKFPEIAKIMSTLGQIVVDGRIYLSPAECPLTNTGTASPNRPPQQQSPSNNPLLQQQSSTTIHHHPPSTFQQHQQQQQCSRLPPPYTQYSNNSPSQFHQQQQQQNLTSPRMSHSGNSGVMQQNSRLFGMQRSPPLSAQRMLMPRMAQNSSQQQVSSSTHPQNLMPDSNLRGLLQPNNNSTSTSNTTNPVYIQTGPSQYQAVQPHLAQQYQNRFPSVSKYPNNGGGGGQMQWNHNANQNNNIALANQNNANNMALANQNNANIALANQNNANIALTNQNNASIALANQNNGSMALANQMAALRSPHTGLVNQTANSLRMGGLQRMHMQQQLLQQQQQLHQRNQLNQMHGGGARWHIPQQVANQNNPMRNGSGVPVINDNFKIRLGQPSLPSTVTSTIPKTPSPNTVHERHLDQYCENSVKDLMATIAKLDSNGVQVVAEGRGKTTGDSPHVDSSTGDGLGKMLKSDPAEMGKDDPNEDWCAVCMDGGELVCCDKCPKVFHQYCHIPNLSVEENDTWQCLLCTNFADFPDHLLLERKDGELNYKEKKIAERIILEMYCQYDPSLPFREVIGPENEEYHNIIKTPIALDTIRQKLNWNALEHYTSLDQLIKDVRLMFNNAYTYNPEDSQVYADARTLEKFFDEQLEKFLPEYAYEHFGEDDTLQPPNKKYKRIIND